MYLQLIQFIERKNLDIITQVIHRKKLTATSIMNPRFGYKGKSVAWPFINPRLVMNHLEQRTRPQKTPLEVGASMVTSP